MKKFNFNRTFLFGAAFVTLALPTEFLAQSLSLEKIEKAALSQSPEMKAIHAKAQALGQSAIAADQLSDPKLSAGALNMPTDSFNFNQENMTQIQIGLSQQFPKGRSLHYSSEVKLKLSTAEMDKEKLMRLHVLQGVRDSWLQLYLWQKSRRIILDQKKVFLHLLKVTESMLSNNKAKSMDVVRAQLEVSELDNRLLQVEQKVVESRAQLARWVGVTLAAQAQPGTLPSWSKPATLVAMNKLLKQHPVIQVDSALILAGHAGIKLANQQYIPGVTLGTAYGIRQGNQSNGKRRSDFLSAQISFNLPFFTKNRQDRSLQASKQRFIANEQRRASDYRKLRDLLSSKYVAWQQQKRSYWLYRSKLIPQAKQYSEATMIAYQNAQTDFPTLARAYVRELRTEIEGLKASVNQSTARVALLYLQGQ